MLAIATIVFREVIEVALVLSIVMAATRGMPRRFVLALAGLGLGVFGSFLVALFTDQISQAIDGVGQEVFNAVIMFIAVGFLSWTVVWMKKHGRDMSRHLKEVGQDVMAGKRPLYMIIAVIALSTLREGAEIVLFTYGMLASGQMGIGSVIAGGALGAAGGAVVGVMLYMGLLKAAQRYLFTVTSWMLIILTAGIAAQGANFLIAAGILPALVPQVWDTSSIISGSSFIGETLKVLIGYTPRPTGMELAFYAAVLLGVGTLYRLAGSPKRSEPQVTAPAE